MRTTCSVKKFGSGPKDTQGRRSVWKFDSGQHVTHLDEQVIGFDLEFDAWLTPGRTFLNI